MKEIHLTFEQLNVIYTYTHAACMSNEKQNIRFSMKFLFKTFMAKELLLIITTHQSSINSISFEILLVFLSFRMK